MTLLSKADIRNKKRIAEKYCCLEYGNDIKSKNKSTYMEQIDRIRCDERNRIHFGVEILLLHTKYLESICD